VSTGQITRESALATLQQPPYDESLQESDCVYVTKKLGFSDAEFKAIMTAPTTTFADYHSYSKVLDAPLMRTARRIRRALRTQFGAVRA
jgi:hypothetical protein